jgi:hypothetical protein
MKASWPILSPSINVGAKSLNIAMTIARPQSMRACRDAHRHRNVAGAA